jgi:hypothetical protein
MIPWCSKDHPVEHTLVTLDSPVMNTPSSQLFGVFGQATEQVYKKTFW